MMDPTQLKFATPFADNPITDDDDGMFSDEESASAEESASQLQLQRDPLSLAIDDLEARAVSALNEFKSHPGRVAGSRDAHDELSRTLRPVVEASAHSAPAAGRAVASAGHGRLEHCVDAIYARINSELILPVLLESARSEMVPAKRAASLRTFHELYAEWCRPGSWLDGWGEGMSSAAGPYGTEGAQQAGALGEREKARRVQVRSLRKSELLRRWIQACLPSLSQSFTSAALDVASAGRGVISASAALKPALKFIAERIGEADDAGALRLFLPVMRMIAGVLGRLFLENDDKEEGGPAQQGNDALRSSCIKFLEIVVLCFSYKNLPGAAADQRPGRIRKDANQNDFALEDLPPGHPIITRESLEEIGEYAFSTLRGLVVLGGQAKIHENFLQDAAAVMNDGGQQSPFQQILAIIKPAALAFQKVESEAEKAADTNDSFQIDRSTIELDFPLSQKSYSISINAIQMLGTKRPLFFKEASTCLARRTMDPPGGAEGQAEGLLSKSAITGIRTHLRSSCLTLMRHILSVTSGCWEILLKALAHVGMEAQAERALKASRQQLDLMKGGRAARTRAAIFYEWDTSADASRAEKRQRDTDDAEARVRAAKIARGLGAGVQLPTSMSDSCELVLLNLKHAPAKRPPVASSVQRRQAVSLDVLVDAVLSNGASLSVDENHWYDRDGGFAWTIEEGEADGDGRQELMYQCKVTENETFMKQSNVAASRAFSRVLQSASSTRSEAATNLGKQLAARLAWMLKGVEPSNDLKDAQTMAAATEHVQADGDDSTPFAREYPLMTTCLGYDLVSPEGEKSSAASSGLSTRVLNEIFICNYNGEDDEDSPKKKQYSDCLDLYVASVVKACINSNTTPSDNEKKRIANFAASSLPHQLLTSPSVTTSSLRLVASLCDIEEVSKKAARTPKQSIAESSAAHAAKAAAEKRATSALLVLRDVAFQRDRMRGSAVGCAVAIAAGRVPASPPIQDKALKLVMNVLYQKNSDCAGKVVESATTELEHAAQMSIDNHEKISKANSVKDEKQVSSGKVQLAPQSDEEKVILEKVKKPVVLFMALCVRRPEIIKVIMEMSCRDGADVMAKAVKANMPKLAKAASVKYGAASIALKVADMASEKEIPLLLSFLDNLAPASDKTLPSQELIDACHEIQRNKSIGGTRDSRYIIPIVSGMTRVELKDRLPEFVQDSDETFKASLRRMSERLSRYALLYRDEPDPNEPTLRGMSSCEQIVNLHRLDFNAVGLPQKRYLDVIRLCLEDDEVFNDRVIQAALDYISSSFLQGETLPLAYMRTIILTCSKHESLHSWICHVLLPRLVEGKVYTDKRQWEGWMRCAKMLENTGDHGVSSMEAIARLPPDQLNIYRSKYPK